MTEEITLRVGLEVNETETQAALARALRPRDIRGRFTRLGEEAARGLEQGLRNNPPVIPPPITAPAERQLSLVAQRIRAAAEVAGTMLEGALYGAGQEAEALANRLKQIEQLEEAEEGVRALAATFGRLGTAGEEAFAQIADPARRMRVQLQAAEDAANRLNSPLTRVGDDVLELTGRVQNYLARAAPFQQFFQTVRPFLVPVAMGVAAVGAAVIATGAAVASYVTGAGAKYWQTQTDLVKVSTELERQQGRLSLAVGQFAVEASGAEQSGKRFAAVLELLADAQTEINQSEEDHSDLITGLKVGFGALIPPIGGAILTYELLAATGDKAVEMTQGLRGENEAAIEGFAVLSQQLEIQKIRLEEQKAALEAEIKTGNLSTQEKQDRIRIYNELLTKEKILAAAIEDARARSTSLIDRLQALRASLTGLKGDFASAADAALGFAKRAGESILRVMTPRKGTQAGGGGGSKPASPFMAEASEGLTGGAVGLGGQPSFALSSLDPFVRGGALGVGAGQQPQGFSLAERGAQLGEAWKSAVPAFQAAAEAQARIVQEGLRMDGLNTTVQSLVTGFADLGGQVAETLGVFAAGGGTLKGFGDAMLDTFSGLAGKLGDYYIALGIAMTAALDPIGPAVFLGGLGLKAVAGFLGQKGSGNAGGGRSGGAAGRAAGDRVPFLSRTSQEKPQETTVNVIIDGDRIARQTGERARLGHLTLSPYAPRGARG